MTRIRLVCLTALLIMTNACSTQPSGQVTLKTPTETTFLRPNFTGTTLQIPATGTLVPTSQNKKLKTPVFGRIEVSSEYLEGLETIYALGSLALTEKKWHDYPWKQTLYELLRHTETVAPEELKPQTARLLVDMRMGLELMDYGLIREALSNIDLLQSQVE